MKHAFQTSQQKITQRWGRIGMHHSCSSVEAFVHTKKGFNSLTVEETFKNLKCVKRWETSAWVCRQPEAKAAALSSLGANTDDKEYI